MKVVAGVFTAQSQAQQALQELQGAGFDPQRVSVIARDSSRARDVAEETGAEVRSGTATGAGAGAVLGGLAGLLVGVGALAIPGIGPVIAAGPIAAALGTAGTTAAVGAGAGAVAGGVVGALTGWGFSESEAREYQERVGRGDMLLAVEIPDDQDSNTAEEILRRCGGERVSTGTAHR